MHKCPHCGYSFPDKGSLKAHTDGGCPDAP
jgi:hypothetical protein